MPSQLAGKVTNLLPKRVRSLLIRVHRRLLSSPIGARVLGYHGTREDLLDYWRSPRDDWNLPSRYLNERASRPFLVEIVRRYARPDWKILEIGCNAGANLHHLFRAGFTHLGGIEVNPEAVKLLTATFPKLASHAEIYNAPVEDKIRGIPDGAFNIVFTMAVLEHLHRESEWVFREMARVAKDYLITIEDERSSGGGTSAATTRRSLNAWGWSKSNVWIASALMGWGGASLRVSSGSKSRV